MSNDDKIDTVPPPAGGSAYDEATVVREAPQEVLDAIKKARELAKQAPTDSIPAAARRSDAPKQNVSHDSEDAIDTTAIGDSLAMSQRGEAIERGRSQAPTKPPSKAPQAPRADATPAEIAASSLAIPAPVSPPLGTTLLIAIALVVVVAFVISRLAN